MANVISVTDEIVGVSAGIDKNKVPVGWRWQVRRTVAFDDDTSSTSVVDVPLSKDDLTTHVSAALADQAVDIQNDSRERDQIAADRDAATIRANAAEAKLAAVQKVLTPDS